MANIVLIDTHKCVACRGCQVACKDWNQLPAGVTKFRGTYTNPPALQAHTWTHVVFSETEGGRWLFAKQSCMHCTDAACIKVCPVGAVQRAKNGAVWHDPAKCAGCGLCEENCPFQVPKVNKFTKKMGKCNGCVARVSNGLKPACVATCPNGALEYGDRKTLIAKAEKQVEALQAKGFKQAALYGVNELGGLGRVYILTQLPGDYGLPPEPKHSASTWFWQVAMVPVRKLASLGLVSGAAIGFLRWRAERIEGKKDKHNSI